MAILEKEVLVKYSNKTYKYYESLGYVFPRVIDESGKSRIKRGTEILIKLNDLSKGSNTNVTKICDICGKYIPNQKYATVLICRKDKIDKCLECQTKEKGYNRGIANEENCIANYDPEFAKLFWDFEDTYKYSCRSGKTVDFKCPDCGHKIGNKIIANVHKQGLSCPVCSDGVSYPEKFMFNMLEQLGINFEYQKLFDDWFEKDKKRFYDFYVPHVNTIIETHGKQHFIGGFERYGEKARSLDDEIKNDEFKRKIALNNNIKNYIIIDSRESTLEHMRFNILNSILSNIFDLTKIDWSKCHECACKSIVKTTCELWNIVKNVSEVSRKLKLDRHTISRYLNQGAKLGWCDYDADSAKKKPIKIIQLTKKGKFLNEFPSQVEAANNYGISPSTISSACTGRYNLVNGYIWLFKDDYDNMTEKELQEKIDNVNKTRKKEVYQLDRNLNLVNTYSSIKEAEELTKTYHISNVCKGKQKYAGGFKWMYKEDYEKHCLMNNYIDIKRGGI